MYDRRLSLHEKLCEILNNRNAYFQPPKNLAMNYPAIRYSLSDVKNEHANDKKYKSMDSYEIIVIDRNPVSEIAKKISDLRYCNFNRSYASDNLNHFVFTLYY